MSTASGNRFSPVTPDDQAGSVWITSLLCLIYSVIVLVVRVILRRKVFGTDDWLVAGATVSQPLLRGCATKAADHSFRLLK
jgi:hypothetical protein